MGLCGSFCATVFVFYKALLPGQAVLLSVAFLIKLHVLGISNILEFPLSFRLITVCIALSVVPLKIKVKASMTLCLLNSLFLYPEQH